MSSKGSSIGHENIVDIPLTPYNTMETLSTTSSRRSLMRRWRDKLARTKSQPPGVAACERCARISHIIQSELKWNTRLTRAPDVFSDSLHLHFDLKEPLWCPFCQLLLDAYQQSHWSINETELNVLAYFVDVSPHGNPKPGSWGIAVVSTDIEPPIKRTPIKYNYPPLRREYRRLKGLVLPVANARPPDQLGRVACLIEGTVNYKIVKQYIDKCDTSHPKCSFTMNARGPDVTVIDCESKRIVQIQPAQQYCTLSYVNGERPSESDVRGKTKNDKIWPRTFLDAIHVTLSLGYRYLWIDRYCIPPNYPENKQVQTSMMDRIFGNSQITIVAAAGNDCHAGLPGAGTQPLLVRKRQRQALLNGAHFVLANVDARSIRSTEWSHRAWTYQEAVLSRRCLVFTPEQVFFLCQTDCYAEAMPSTPQLNAHKSDNLTLQTLSSEVFTSTTPPDGSPAPHGKLSSLDVLEDHASAYSFRALRVEEDALNAFRGILARSGYWSYWGIPSIPPHGVDHPRRDAEPSDIPTPIFHGLSHLTLGFLRGLAWFVVKTEGKKIRGRGTAAVPSWSWLSFTNGRTRFLCHPEYEPSKKDTYFFGLGDEIEVSIAEREVENDITSEVVWTPLSNFWQNMDVDTRIIPEQDVLLKLEAPVANIAQVLITIKQNSAGVAERSVVVGYRTGHANQLRQLIAKIDDEDILPSLPTSVLQQAFTNLPWKLVKITSWTHCHINGSDSPTASPLTAAYLIVAPGKSYPYWCRKGIAVTPGYEDEEFLGQAIATIAVTTNSTQPAQTTSRIPGLNDDGFQTTSIILT